MRSGRRTTFESLRAKLKRDLREGTARLEQILATGADYLASAEVFDLLVAVPKIGPVKANHLLTLARINPSKTVGRSPSGNAPPHQVAQPLAPASAMRRSTANDPCSAHCRPLRVSSRVPHARQGTRAVERGRLVPDRVRSGSRVQIPSLRSFACGPAGGDHGPEW